MALEQPSPCGNFVVDLVVSVPMPGGGCRKVPVEVDGELTVDYACMCVWWDRKGRFEEGACLRPLLTPDPPPPSLPVPTIPNHAPTDPDSAQSVCPFSKYARTHVHAQACAQVPPIHIHTHTDLMYDVPSLPPPRIVGPSHHMRNDTSAVDGATRLRDRHLAAAYGGTPPVVVNLVRESLNLSNPACPICRWRLEQLMAAAHGIGHRTNGGGGSSGGGGMGVPFGLGGGGGDSVAAAWATSA